MPAGATLAAVVRHRVLRRQLAPHLPAAGLVVDLGCGPGRLAVDLVRDGHRVIALDADAAMVDMVRRRRSELTSAEQARLEVVAGRVEDMGDLVAPASVDVVCCHAVLPFVQDHRAMLAAAVAFLRPGGVVSVVAKNAAALPVRAALQGRFAAALALVEGADERDDRGAVLRAHHRDDVIAALVDAGASVVGWHGLQVVTSHRDDLPDPATVAAAVELELRLGDRNPARLLARQFHVVATRGRG